jgi:hypothetical protein
MHHLCVTPPQTKKDMKAYIVRRAPEPYDPAAVRHQSNAGIISTPYYCAVVGLIFRMIPTCRDRGEMRRQAWQSLTAAIQLSLNCARPSSALKARWRETIGLGTYAYIAYYEGRGISTPAWRNPPSRTFQIRGNSNFEWVDDSYCHYHLLSSMQMGPHHDKDWELRICHL